MTQDLTFSFKTAAEGALRDHPELNDYAVMAWVDEDLCADPLQGVPLETYGNLVLCSRAKNNPYLRQNLYDLVKKLGSSCVVSLKKDVYANCMTAPKALLHYNRTYSYVAAISEEKTLSSWFSFFHELGHIVCKNGSGSADKTLMESAADTYAALRLLKMHGDVALGYISRWAVSRSMRFLSMEKTDHLTLPALVAVMQLYQEQPNTIRNMSSQECADAADAIAASLSYKPDEQSALCNAYKGLPTFSDGVAAYCQSVISRLKEIQTSPRLFFPGAVAAVLPLGQNGLALKDGSIVHHQADISLSDKALLADSDRNGALGLIIENLHHTPTGRAPRPQIMGF